MLLACWASAALKGAYGPDFPFDPGKTAHSRCAEEEEMMMEGEEEGERSRWSVAASISVTHAIRSAWNRVVHPSGDEPALGDADHSCVNEINLISLHKLIGEEYIRGS